MHLDDRALRIEKEDLVPVAREARAVVTVRYAVGIQVLLERLDVVCAIRNVPYRPHTDRVDHLAASEGDAQVLCGQVHLHVAVRSEGDRHVRARAGRCLRVAREHRDGHLIHFHHVPVEGRQSRHLATHDVDVVQLRRREGIAGIVPAAVGGVDRQVNSAIACRDRFAQGAHADRRSGFSVLRTCSSCCSSAWRPCSSGCAASSFRMRTFTDSSSSRSRACSSAA
mmetsp:Transcript_83532/g.250357  ORF Transcript_83532/g.250357 Transcript_83532/m.250357 type:complete len:225 (-) Transcript_83532:8-682(-)